MNLNSCWGHQDWDCGMKEHLTLPQFGPGLNCLLPAALFSTREVCIWTSGNCSLGINSSCMEISRSGPLQRKPLQFLHHSLDPDCFVSSIAILIRKTSIQDHTFSIIFSFGSLDHCLPPSPTSLASWVLSSYSVLYFPCSNLPCTGFWNKHTNKLAMMFSLF